MIRFLLSGARCVWNCIRISLLLTVGLLAPLWARADANVVRLARANEARGSAYDLPSLRNELQNLQDSIGEHSSSKALSQIGKSLSPSWTVTTSGRTYSVSTAPLKKFLAAGSRDQATVWLQHLSGLVAGAETTDAASAGTKHQLHSILARPEFASLGPPSAWDLLRQRIVDRIERIVSGVLGDLSRHPMGGEILFWLLVVAAVAFGAFLVVRFFTGQQKDKLSPGPSAANEQSWQEWLRAARFAADHGDFRQAVHSAYWAGIVRLEDTGIVTRDRARTPREYVRAISQQKVEFSAASNSTAALLALTTALERVWYANRAASAVDFADSLRQLDAIGCPLD